MAYPLYTATILQLMGYEPDTDFEVWDDGAGPYIAVWLHADPEPTDTDVNNFYASYLAHPDRLVEQKTEAKRLVDEAAEVARLRYVTTGSAQAMVYLRKETEADAYKLAGYPAVGSPNEYPHLTQEAANTGQTEQQVADLIIATRDLWIEKSALIEGERMGGKKNVDDAADESAVDTARDNAVAALDAI